MRDIWHNISATTITYHLHFFSTKSSNFYNNVLFHFIQSIIQTTVFVRQGKSFFLHCGALCWIWIQLIKCIRSFFPKLTWYYLCPFVKTLFPFFRCLISNAIIIIIIFISWKGNSSSKEPRPFFLRIANHIASQKNSKVVSLLHTSI